MKFPPAKSPLENALVTLPLYQSSQSVEDKHKISIFRVKKINLQL